MRISIWILIGVLAPALASGQETGELVISEIMYNSPGMGSDVEYFELYNHTQVTVDLTGWTVLDEDDLHVAVPLSGSLAPGEVLVVAGDMALFSAMYPSVTNVNPSYFQPGWNLGGTDTIRVFNASTALVDIVAYDDLPPWPPEADGTGPALELIDPALDNNDFANWRLTEVGGTPGSYTGPSPVDTASWGLIKSLYQ